MKLNLTTPTLISSFRFLVEKKPNTAVVSDIFAADLNGDGIQEAIFLGRQSQPASIQTWSNSTIHIFQASGNGWVDVTQTMLPDNVIGGTEPNCLFGDFNNDGKVDFFVPADTDMNYLLPSYLFTNTGSVFTKQAFDFQTWAHGAYAADVNQDGYLDVLSTDYGSRAGIGFGGPNGFIYKSNDKRLGFGFSSSGISAADFLGDGSVTIMVSDNVGYPSGTGLFGWSLDIEGQLSFKLISTLPMPRFELPKWDYKNFNPGDGSIPKKYLDDSHDVRVVPFDFSGDRLMDAIVMSRPSFTDGTWPEYSEIQFLLNKGKGVFADVTDTLLIGYNTSTSASYQPVFMDFNSDGRTDIFLSAVDYSGIYNSTTLLIQQPNGTFLDTAREAFTAAWDSAVASVSQFTPNYIQRAWTNPMQLVKGIDGRFSLLGYVNFTDDQNGQSSMVFSSALSISELQLNEKLIATSADDVFDGGYGLDLVAYEKPTSNYTISRTSTGQLIVIDNSGTAGKDELRNIERLQFQDKSVAFDLSQNAGTTAKILGAVLGKESLSNKNYVGIGLSFLDAGWTYDNLAALALDASGAKSNDQVVSLLWTNVIGTKPTAADKAPYIALLENGMSAGALAHLAADSTFNTTNINLVGLAQTGIEYIPVS
jgi:hypothetical protein